MLLDGTPAILYTGIIQKVKGSNYQVQNLAYPKNRSDPLLREWIKLAGNPVTLPEPKMNRTLFRDPTTPGARMVYGTCSSAAARGSTHGIAYHYQIRDFKRWAGVRRPLHSAPTGCGSARTSIRSWSVAGRMESILLSGLTFGSNIS
jgi:beta-fructofuranosidase